MTNLTVSTIHFYDDNDNHGDKISERWIGLPMVALEDGDGGLLFNDQSTTMAKEGIYNCMKK